jgi:thioredoxin 1
VENGIVAIKFFAEWCGPCGLYRPVFERAAARNPSIEFYEVDVDKAPEIAAKYGIMSLPTTVILKDGEVVQKAPGAKSSARLEFLLTDVLDS